MGIRIRKAMGYALLDLEATEEGDITDSRINSDSAFAKYERLPSLEKYKAWLNNLSEEEADTNEHRSAMTEASMIDQLVTPNDPNRSLTDAVIFESEMGLPNVILFQPVSSYDWNHNDDPIDYALATNMEPTVTEIKPIFPYDTWMDKRDGRRIKSSDSAEWNQISNSDMDFESKQHYLAGLCISMGFDTADELEDNMVPIVPDAVRLLIEYLEIFCSKDTCNELRPVVYTYWS